LDATVPTPGTPELEPLAHALERMRGDLAAWRAALQRSTAEEVRRVWELEVARDIQQSFLPRGFPEIPGAEVAAMMQAARDVLNRAEEVIAANQESIRQAVKDIATFSAALARNSDNVDVIVSDAKDTMKKAKEATASARTLMDNLDKRTEEITVGVNRMTSTATRQIDIAGRAITDLAHNPQRFLFGGSGSSSSDSSSSASSPPPAPPPARTAPARTPTPPPAPARAQR